MSLHHDPTELELREDLVETRLKLYHEKCRREGNEHEIRRLKSEIGFLRGVLDRIDIALGERPFGHAPEVITLLQEWRDHESQ